MNQSIDKYRKCIGSFVTVSFYINRSNSLIGTAMGVLKEITSDNKLFVKHLNDEENTFWEISPEDITYFKASPVKKFKEEMKENHGHFK